MSCAMRRPMVALMPLVLLSSCWQKWSLGRAAGRRGQRSLQKLQSARRRGATAGERGAQYHRKPGAP